MKYFLKRRNDETTNMIATRDESRNQIATKIFTTDATEPFLLYTRSPPQGTLRDNWCEER